MTKMLLSFVLLWIATSAALMGGSALAGNLRNQKFRKVFVRNVLHGGFAAMIAVLVLTLVVQVF